MAEIQLNIVTQPQNGALTLAAGGSVNYTPNVGFIGVDSFTYQVIGASGEISNTATVNIDVVEQIPVFEDCEIIPDIHYQEQAEALMLNQFCDSPNLTALFRENSKHSDNINDILRWILDNTDLETASCFMLDIIGALVGQSRIVPNSVRLPFFGFEGQPNVTGFCQAPFADLYDSTTTSSRLDDSAYRIAIKAKILSNTGSTSMTGVANMLQFLYNSSLISIHNLADANIRAYVSSDISAADRLVISALGIKFSAAGVGMEVLVSPGNETFGFDDSPFGFTGFNQGLFVDDFQEF